MNILTSATVVSKITPDNLYHFGFELRLSVKPIWSSLEGLGLTESPWTKDFAASAVRLAVETELLEAGFEGVMGRVFRRGGTEDDDQGGVRYYQAWVIVEVGDAGTDIEDGYRGVYILSPILNATNHWKRVLQRIWSAITTYFVLQLDGTIPGIRVHATTSTYQWESSQAKVIAKAIIAFDPLIDALLSPEKPNERDYGSPGITSNALTPAMKHLLSGGGLKPVYTHIDSLSIEDLVTFISPSATHSFSWYLRNAHNDSGRKTSRFTFQRSLGCGPEQGSTINADRPTYPGAEMGVTSIKWIAFVLAFLKASETEIIPLELGATDEAKLGCLKSYIGNWTTDLDVEETIQSAELDQVAMFDLMASRSATANASVPVHQRERKEAHEAMLSLQQEMEEQEASLYDGFKDLEHRLTFNPWATKR